VFRVCQSVRQPVCRAWCGAWCGMQGQPGARNRI